MNGRVKKRTLILCLTFIKRDDVTPASALLAIAIISSHSASGYFLSWIFDDGVPAPEKFFLLKTLVLKKRNAGEQKACKNYQVILSKSTNLIIHRMKDYSTSKFSE